MTSGYPPMAKDEEDYLFASLCDDDWMFPVLDEIETSIISDSLEGQLSEGYDPISYIPPANTAESIYINNGYSTNSNTTFAAALYQTSSSSSSTSDERGSRKACKRGPESSSAGSSSRDESSSSSSSNSNSNNKLSTPNTFTVEIVPQSVTASQLAAVTGGATVAFNFPSVDVFPAQIGGPWNDGSDDEADDCFDDSVEGDKNISGKKKGKKRVRPLNPDADLIAAATEASLLQMGIDPDSKEGKRQKKVIRNRMSAQMHRERKKAYISYLESIVRHREAKMIELQERSAFVNKENTILRSQLASGGLGGAGGDNSSLDGASLPADDYGMTSDDTISVSSKSSLSTAASSSLRTSSHHPKLFKSALSLLSVAMMACFTMYSAPIGPSFGHPMASVSPFSHPAIDSSSQHHSSAIKMLSSGPSASYDHEDATAEDAENSETPSDRTHRISLPISRRLVSMAPVEPSRTGDDSADSEPSTKGLVIPYSSLLDTSPSGKAFSSVFASTGLADGHMSISESLLWNKYSPENTVQLYPRIPNISVVKKKTHLRSRFNDSDRDRDIDPSVIASVDPARKPQYYSTASNSYIRQLDTASRVLLHTGRALLDPSLSGTALIPADTVKNANTALSTYVKRGGGGGDGDDLGGNKEAKGPILSIGLDAASSNVLYMMLPASQIRWGKSLDESYSSDSIFRGLNYSVDDAENAYVELGCTVFKADIIKNVSFQA